VLLEAVRAEAAASGDESLCSACHVRLADIALRAGDWRRGEAYAAAAHELAEQIGLTDDAGFTLYFKARVDLHAGRVEEARASAEAAIELPGRRTHRIPL
jgi:hypothetical protein